MKLTVKPVDDSLMLLLEAGQYQHIWDEYGDKLQAAYTSVTGLEFQQETIDAVVHNDALNSAGDASTAMHLSGQAYSQQDKTCTLVHELGHRLLGGNALSPIGLGLVADAPEPHPRYQEYDHRHLYLFLFEVIEQVFGKELADYALADEAKRAETTLGHAVALQWARVLSKQQRRSAIHKLAAEALPRTRWHERDDTSTLPRDPAKWFAYLVTD